MFVNYVQMSSDKVTVTLGKSLATSLAVAAAIENRRKNNSRLNDAPDREVGHWHIQTGATVNLFSLPVA